MFDELIVLNPATLPGWSEKEVKLLRGRILVCQTKDLGSDLDIYELRSDATLWLRVNHQEWNGSMLAEKGNPQNDELTPLEYQQVQETERDGNWLRFYGFLANAQPPLAPTKATERRGRLIEWRARIGPDGVLTDVERMSHS